MLQRAGSRPARGRAHQPGHGRERAAVRADRRGRRLDRRHAGTAPGRGAEPPADADRALPAQRRRRDGAPDRHAAGQGSDRRLDRRRHDLPERSHSRVRRHAGRRSVDRPGRRGAHQRGGHAQGGPGPGQVVHPQAGREAHQLRDPGPELRAARVPPGRRPTVPAAPPAGILLRHHDHAGVPVQRARRGVRADRLRQAGRRVEVPLRLRRIPVHPPGPAHGDVLQPAEGTDAAGALPARPGHSQGHLRHGGAPPVLRDQHRPDLRQRADHRVAGPARRPDRALTGRHMTPGGAGLDPGDGRELCDGRQPCGSR